jgi:hypothetical protein
MDICEYILANFPPDIAERAIANHRAQGWSWEGSRIGFLADPTPENAITAAFSWVRSPEGLWYWIDICDQLENG